MNKNEWNLRDEIRRTITEAFFADDYSTTAAEEIASRLCVEIEANYKCPHVITSDEGTSYCNLAESSVKDLQAALSDAKNKLQQAQKKLSRSRPKNAANHLEDL